MMELELFKRSALSSLVGLALGTFGCKDDDGGAGMDSGTSAATEGTDSVGDTETDSAGTMGSATESSDTDVPGIPPEEAIVQLVEARCQWLFNCCAAGEIDYELGPFTADAADCTNRVISVLESGTPGSPVAAGPSDLLLALTQSFALGRISLDANAVQACVDYLANEGCTPALAEGQERCDPADSQPLDDPCDLRLLAIGRQDVGEECEPLLQAECAAGARCVDFGTSGVCAALSAEGEPCFADTDCDEAFVCDLAGTGNCVMGAAVGQACSFADPMNPLPGTELDRCGRGLTCATDDFTCAGGSCGPGAPCTFDAECPEGLFCIVDACQPPQGGGGPCEVNEHCQSNFCSLGTNVCSEPSGMPDGTSCFSNFQCLSAFCDPVALICTPPKAPGQPCPSGQAAECEDGFCQPPAMGVGDGTCVAYGQEGDPCTTVSDCDPAESFSCVNMTCQKLPNGDSCFSNAQCVSGLCFANLCDTPLSVGDNCGAAAMGLPCEEGSFCDIPLGETDGNCTALQLTGTPCVTEEQCYGSCVEIWGERLCDDTPPVGAAWCDGM